MCPATVPIQLLRNCAGIINKRALPGQNNIDVYKRQLQSEVESYYHDKPREKKKLSQEKAFRQIKNTVIQEAECIRLGEITFEDADLAGHDEPEQMRGESDSCWELRQIVRDESLSLADRDGAAEELERLAERGDAHAQYLLGQLYRDGPLLIPDSQKAKNWFTQAADRGLSEAQYALGKLLLSCLLYTSRCV